VVVFALIAAFILLISCFNFINLSIAIHSKRTIETGIKKVLGARPILFFRQVMLEIMVYLLLGTVFSYVIVQLALPGINSVIDKHLVLNLPGNYWLWTFIAGLFVAILLICGSIPFFMLWKSNTTGLLKGVTLFRHKSVTAVAVQSTFKHSLVVAQFAIGILLVIATLVVNKQMRLIRQHNTGFDKEQLVRIDNQEGDQLRRYQLLRSKIQQYPEIKDITCGSGVPFYGINNWGGPKVHGEDEKNMQGCGFISVDENYLSTIGAQFIDGRNFTQGSSADHDKIIISESLAKALQLEHPVGTLLDWLWSNEPREIIGVVKDIEYHSIRERSYPVVYFCQRTDVIGYTQQILMKLQSNNLPAVMDRLRKDWDEISPDYPMDYAFLDQRFDENYRSEQQTSLFLNIMAAVAIILCSLGLFGLAVFHINARIKEIGIRKVNGAKISEILALLNKDFVIWVMIAFVVAAPIAYLIIKKWLENFTVKTQLNWWLFIASGVIALLIALITVSVQTWRAASRNPVEALRYE
jgi:putative ABC transport system permease protein